MTRKKQPKSYPWSRSNRLKEIVLRSLKIKIRIDKVNHKRFLFQFQNLIAEWASKRDRRI